jgi:hypothetical protein
VCQCGAAISACPVWRAVLESPNRDITHGYRELFARLSDLYGASATIVDSSKTTDALDALVAAGADVVVVRLTRGSVAWARGQRARARTNSTQAHRIAGGHDAPVLVRAKLRLANTALPLAMTWHRMNRQLDEHVASLGLRTIHLSFESLVEKPDIVLPLLRRLIGLGPVGDESMLLPGPAQHQIYGNSTRHSSVALRPPKGSASRQGVSIAPIVLRGVRDYENALRAREALLTHAGVCPAQGTP